MRTETKGPYRMPADSNDVDELKAYIRDLEAELEIEEALQKRPWWCIPFSQFIDPPFAAGVVGLLGLLVVAGAAAGHAATLLSWLGFENAYFTFWVWALHLVGAGALWGHYMRKSWDADKASTEPPFSIKKAHAGRYYISRYAKYYAVDIEEGGRLRHLHMCRTLKGAAAYTHKRERTVGA